MLEGLADEKEEEEEEKGEDPEDVVTMTRHDLIMWADHLQDGANNCHHVAKAFKHAIELLESQSEAMQLASAQLRSIAEEGESRAYAV